MKHCLIRYSLPALVIVATWFSVIEHYYVPNPVITPEMVERARLEPSDEVLKELSAIYFFGPEPLGDPVQAAESILRGTISLPGEPPRSFRFPFDPDDIDQGSVAWQLFYARMVIPRILLSAYRLTEREAFLLAARDVIVAWSEYECRAVLPRGLLWNDHAIAERVLALADFWSVYRDHPSHDAAVAATVLAFAARSGRFLADPDAFTGSTNHGLMQNMGLWHLSLAFPSLPEAETFARTAEVRLAEQIPFFINAEDGFILEHSAGYHKSGLQFMSLIFRYMSLQQIAIPLEWKRSYEKAKAVYAELRRPDGSLPMFGDTDGAADAAGPLVTVPDREGRYGPPAHEAGWFPRIARSLHPTSGYAIWWDGLERWPEVRELSQTTVIWSHFSGHAHKHADEMSVLLWAGGQSWLTNVGYWPYGTEGRGEADSWSGSNAPHLAGESSSSSRTTRLLAHGWIDGLSVIDLERREESGWISRRQVLRLSEPLWLIVDSAIGGKGQGTRTVWNMAHDVRVEPGSIAGSYDLFGARAEASMTAFMLGSEGTALREHRGSLDPFAGWEVIGSVIRPASSIVVEQPASDSWAVSIWALNPAGSRAIGGMPSMRLWNGPEAWTVEIPGAERPILVSREAWTVRTEGATSGRPMRLDLERSATAEGEIARIRSAHETVATKYPRFHDEVPYRLKVTALVIALLVLQEVFFLVYRRITDHHHGILHSMSAVAWLILGVWLIVVRVNLI